MRVFWSIPININDIKIYLDFIKNNKDIDIDLNVIKFVPEENLHVTLHFLGDLDKELAIEVSDRVNEFYNNNKNKFNNFELNISDIGFLDSFNNKALVLFINPNKKLTDLYNILGDILKNKNIKNINLENSKYLPHITIGKIKNTDVNNDIVLNIDRYLFSNNKIKVCSFEFIESILGQSGSRYNKIISWNLNY